MRSLTGRQEPGKGPINQQNKLQQYSGKCLQASFKECAAWQTTKKLGRDQPTNKVSYNSAAAGASSPLSRNAQPGRPPKTREGIKQSTK
eukprot:350033-Pelagomonas_calceolata.AAC.2